ncbi:uncharacterized protein LOC132257033 [Phlebotomus argentipes]|uniref:uncharacterized protein LOC132257033 n=1 Tax=Phlebotomus argentipes TaxID=94469 RepID=UPI0028933F48|nr:uncharacterized protein LOC132257033 [Phlebotomus argentipes]
MLKDSKTTSTLCTTHTPAPRRHMLPLYLSYTSPQRELRPVRVHTEEPSVAARWLSEDTHRHLLGIPISPGDIITAHSDVVVGKPAILGPPRRPYSFLEIRKSPLVSNMDLPPKPSSVNLKGSQVLKILLAPDGAEGRASERYEVLKPPDSFVQPPPVPKTEIVPFSIHHHPVNVIRQSPKNVQIPSRTTIQTILFKTRTTPRRSRQTPRPYSAISRITTPRIKTKHNTTVMDPTSKHMSEDKIESISSINSFSITSTAQKIRTSQPTEKSITTFTVNKSIDLWNDKSTASERLINSTHFISKTSLPVTSKHLPSAKFTNSIVVPSEISIVSTNKSPQIIKLTSTTESQPVIFHTTRNPATLGPNTKMSEIRKPTTETPSSIEMIVGTASRSRPFVHIGESPPARDEQALPEVSHAMLGDILMASTPTTTETAYELDCWPPCRSDRNEVCRQSSTFSKCACRAGFARMFPDRPCRPTYTYAMGMRLGRLGGAKLFWDSALINNSSARFHHMQTLAHEALERAAMQSDLHDIYYGLIVNGFEPDKNAGVIWVYFRLQLSDNSDERRLQDIFKKYLRSSDLNLGGTELFAADLSIVAVDFDECRYAVLHDCSPDAICFNLRGTYTCGCREGFIDVSENTLYPGRHCSAEPIGCATCTFHGICVPPPDNRAVARCECFAWYSGTTCRVNLKALLIALATLAAILVCILIGCIMTTERCSTRRHCGTLIVPVMSLRSRKVDCRAIVDNASETSDDVIQPSDNEQALTVMIPRAKYQSRQSVSSLCNPKLLNYLDVSLTNSASSKQENFAGALVSAGFEVSAIVGESDWQENYQSEVRSYDETTVQPPTKCLQKDVNIVEQDTSSTVLLPHTHLYYPPDKTSDISGFDSV